MQRARARIELRYYMIFTIRRVCVCVLFVRWSTDHAYTDIIVIESCALDQCECMHAIFIFMCCVCSLYVVYILQYYMFYMFVVRREFRRNERMKLASHQVHSLPLLFNATAFCFLSLASMLFAFADHTTPAMAVVDVCRAFSEFWRKQNA